MRFASAWNHAVSALSALIGARHISGCAVAAAGREPPWCSIPCRERTANNAGVPKRRAVTELSPDVVDSVMALNYSSPVRLTLALLPGLIERAGRIVNISSVAARLGPGTEAAYAASKAALTAWSEAMCVDLADTDVHVHVVNPGIIDTELFRLPDNDEPIADMSMALPVEAIVQPVVDQLDSGTFEIYVPEWFQDVVAGKVADPDAFLQGSIEYLRSRRAVS